MTDKNPIFNSTLFNLVSNIKIVGFIVRAAVFVCFERVTVDSVINGHSKKRTHLINGQILFPSNKSNSLVLLSKRRTLLLSGQK